MLIFPTSPVEGQLHVHSGRTYKFHKNSWSTSVELILSTGAGTNGSASGSFKFKNIIKVVDDWEDPNPDNTGTLFVFDPGVFALSLDTIRVYLPIEDSIEIGSTYFYVNNTDIPMKVQDWNGNVTPFEVAKNQTIALVKVANKTWDVIAPSGKTFVLKEYNK